MVGIAMYDAVNAATGLNYRPYSYSGGAVAGASAGAAAYAAGYTMLESLFPAQSPNCRRDTASLLEQRGFEALVPRAQEDVFETTLIPPPLLLPKITKALARGTGGSNSLCSSAESGANLTFLGRCETPAQDNRHGV